MNSKQLEVFVKVAELGSLSKAAIGLGRAQPILSRQIRELESELKTRLFHRTGRGLVVTETGKRLLTRSRRVLEELNQAEHEVRNLGQTQLTNAIIAIPTTLSRILTVPLVREIRSRHPQVHLRVREGTSGPILDWVMQRQVDVAILYDTMPTPRTSTEALCEETMFLISRVDGPALPKTIPVRELAHMPLVLPGEDQGLRMLMEMTAAQVGIPLDVVVEADTFNGIRLLVEDGVGCGILPFQVIEQEVRDGVLQASRLVEPEVQRQLVVTTCSNRISGAGLNELVRIVRQVMRRIMQPMSPQRNSARRAARVL
jgi:LysR family nitrogen assimilation transcriptional regulator